MPFRKARARPLAGQAPADLSEYLRTLERRVSEGFRQAGFPEVKVSAKAEAGDRQIQVAIKEGKRYFNGQIQVQAPREIDADVIERYSTLWNRALGKVRVIIQAS